MFDDVFIGLILSILLGALVGAQREIRQQKENIADFAGFRTFTLVCLLGFFIGYLSTDILNNDNIILIGISGIFLISALAYRAITKMNPKQISTTTAITAILTFILGIIINLGHYQLSIAFAILITTILFLGNSLHKFAKKVTEKEAFATLKFAIISLIILPILPNKNYSLLDFPILGELFSSQTIIDKSLLASLDVFNFYHIWLMVVFISGIGYAGYILMRTIGAEKGILVTGFLGGFMSSTALTSSFSIESKKINYLSNPLAVGTIIACSTMFFRVIVEIAIINPDLLLGITILFSIMGFTGYILALKLFFKKNINHKKKIDVESPFSLGPAMKFAALFVIVIFVSKLFAIILGDSGIYLVAFFSGFADVDAITISLANLAMQNDISNTTAQIGIVLAAFANTIVKGGIAYYLGSRNYSKPIITIFSIIILIGLISLLFLL